MSAGTPGSQRDNIGDPDEKLDEAPRLVVTAVGKVTESLGLVRFGARATILGRAYSNIYRVRREPDGKHRGSAAGPASVKSALAISTDMAGEQTG